MKFLRSLAAALLLLLVSPVFAQEYFAEGDIAGIISRGVLRVAITAVDQPPFYFTGKDGRLAGYDIDLASKMAEELGDGFVMHSKKSKKKNQETLEAFNACTSGVMHTSKAAETGLDIPGIDTEIILYTNSSKIRKTQVLGRSIRYEEGKVAEIFTLVLKGTQEVT